MANRRELKKEINYVCGTLFTECVAISLYNNEANPTDIDKVMSDVLNMQDEYISRISHTQKDKAKSFYALLRKNFDTSVDDVITAIGKIN
ncbi:MAG: hypothetical protein RR386_03440 [Bacteroidaceae bacterium]